MYDCEAADAASISVRSIRPGNNNGFIDFLFYDDTNLDPAFSTPSRNPIGNNTAAGAHKWGQAGVETGTFSGDTKTINSYAVGLLAQGRVLSVAYNGSGCVLVDPVVLTQPLPVELTWFGAALQKDGVRVSWETATERNCDYFAVERSADGRAFAEITRVAGSGTTSQQKRYVTLDAAPLAGVSYYRLRQVDVDGTAHYSPVAVVNNAGRGVATLSPNPATTEVNILFAEALTGSVDIQMTDAAGRVVWREHRDQAGPGRRAQASRATGRRSRYTTTSKASSTSAGTPLAMPPGILVACTHTAPIMIMMRPSAAGRTVRGMSKPMPPSSSAPPMR
jgi:hypothetical protein